jgi:hypothetical protein
MICYDCPKIPLLSEGGSDIFEELALSHHRNTRTRKITRVLGAFRQALWVADTVNSSRIYSVPATYDTSPDLGMLSASTLKDPEKRKLKTVSNEKEK